MAVVAETVTLAASFAEALLAALSAETAGTVVIARGETAVGTAFLSVPRGAVALLAGIALSCGPGIMLLPLGMTGIFLRTGLSMLGSAAAGMTGLVGVLPAVTLFLPRTMLGRAGMLLLLPMPAAVALLRLTGAAPLLGRMLMTAKEMFHRHIGMRNDRERGADDALYGAQIGPLIRRGE